MNYDINEFKNIWKDSDKESIINQFYYEHKELQEVYEVIKEVREYIDEYAWQEDVIGDIYTVSGVPAKYRYMELDWDNCNELLEILDKVSDK